ncbi:MAG: TIGR01777 family oxidoreductase [Solirubrobacterales bacterium]|nr:TIGR01777 family oxidoreductase [Solirubrobacterales bacterium]
MRVVITGSTGTIGLSLARALHARGDDVVALSRNRRHAAEILGETAQVHEWAEPKQSAPPHEALAGADAVVNLLGEPIAQRWTDATKREIRDSRVRSTRSLVEALQGLPDDARPRTLVSQSAVGYYGPRDAQLLDEEAPPGSDFVASVVVDWEREARSASPPLRVAITRTGVVLSPSGGALARMLPFFRLGLGGPIAGGRQYVPWIHLDDVIGAILISLDNQGAEGPLNVTAPNPVTNREFGRALGRALGRPAVLPVPGFALRLLYGEMAEVVTTGQRVLPARLGRLGYQFRHPQVEPALRDVLSRG